MSDTAPKNQDALTWDHHAPAPASRARRPPEVLFQFLRAVDHVRVRCELHDDGLLGGLDVRILRNEELFYSRRFPQDLRQLAERWALDERRALERYHPADDPI